MSSIRYSSSLDGLLPAQLQGFFVGWPNKPSLETHLALLRKSDYRVLAYNDHNQVVGLITAISDGVLSVYIPFLEVLPDYQHQGIGQELMNKLLAQVDDFYMIDLMCDSTVQPFYERLGFQKSTGMSKRVYRYQDGRPPTL